MKVWSPLQQQPHFVYNIQPAPHRRLTMPTHLNAIFTPCRHTRTVSPGARRCTLVEFSECHDDEDLARCVAAVERCGGTVMSAEHTDLHELTGHVYAVFDADLSTIHAAMRADGGGGWPEWLVVWALWVPLNPPTGD